ncbi:MAG: serine/threonine-protein phosphatase, partial [Verrucomicrobiaceae bacterium]
CYANAGHPWPLNLRRTDGQVSSLRQEGTRPGPALGLVDGVTYRSFECQLDAGDSLLLFTDGLFEISGPGDEQFGMQRLTDTLASHLGLSTDHLLQEVISQARQFSPVKEFDDDLCVVGIDLLAPGYR